MRHEFHELSRIEKPATEPIFKEESYRIVGHCMEVHRELGKGHDEVIYKDALEYEFTQARIAFAREKNYLIQYKTIVLPHKYFADFVVFDKVLLEAKAVEQLTDSHVKQVLNYLAASKLKLGLLVNFGEDSLTWKRIVL
jgi:GxxExxY protein